MSTAEFDPQNDDNLYFADAYDEDVTVIGYAAAATVLFYLVGRGLTAVGVSGFVMLSSLSVVASIGMLFSAYLHHEWGRPMGRLVSAIGTLPLWLTLLEALF